MENLKQGLRRAISWNKYRFETSTQPRNNSLDYMIDPTFRNINRLFVLSFQNHNNDPTRDSFDKYYMSLFEIKQFNTLNENKPFLDQDIKNKQEIYEKLVEMSKDYDYTTRNLLDYFDLQDKYKLIGIDLSRPASTSIHQ